MTGIIQNRNSLNILSKFSQKSLCQISVCTGVDFFRLVSLLPTDRNVTHLSELLIDVIRSNIRVISQIRGHNIVVYLQTSGRLDHFRYHHDVYCQNIAEASPSVTLRNKSTTQTNTTSVYGKVVPKLIAQIIRCSHHLSELLILWDHMSDVLWAYRRNP